jgi:hypothetical protein
MDLYGWRPATVNGDYFRNTGSWWHPLAEYCKQIQPEIAAHCTHWHTNDGDGLDEKDSIALAEALQREIDSGRCEAHAKNVEAAATSEICFFCKGTAVCKPFPEVGAGDAATGVKCWGCDGEGRIFSDYFSVGNVQEFVTFLRGCGGFSIW